LVWTTDYGLNATEKRAFDFNDLQDNYRKAQFPVVFLFSGSTFVSEIVLSISEIFSSIEDRSSLEESEEETVGSSIGSETESSIAGSW
jgi:hypothetical protein